MSPVNVGERIRQLRLGLGMSVRTLATKSGFSPSPISQVERSQVTPSIGSLERIAMVLGVSLSKFFVEPNANMPYGRCAPALVRTHQHLVASLDPGPRSPGWVGHAGAHHAHHGARGT